MFYVEKKININEIEDNNLCSLSSFMNISFEEEKSDEPFSSEDTGLNNFKLDIDNSIYLNNSQIKFIEIPENIPLNKPVLGRKRKGSGKKGKHDKYTEDNRIRKSKKVFRDAIFELINSKIENLGFNLDITIDNKEYNKVEGLLNLGQELTKESSVEDNLALFYGPIKSILYEISKKYKNYPKNYNEAVIEAICKNKNKKCKEIAHILNLEYLYCLKYYRRDKDAPKDDYLNGLQTKFDNLPKILKDEGHEKEYEELLVEVIKKIEKIYEDKIPRERRKKDNKKK